MSYRRGVQLTSDILIAFEHHLLLTACEVLNNAIQCIVYLTYGGAFCLQEWKRASNIIRSLEHDGTSQA